MRNGIRQAHAEISGALRVSVSQRNAVDRRAELRHRGGEGPLGAALVLGRDEHRAAPFASERDALRDTERHQQDRPEPAGLVEGRQDADEAGRHAHDGHGDDQGGAAAEPVAEVSEQDRAERTHDERDADGGECGEIRSDRSERLEEQRAGEEG